MQLIDELGSISAIKSDRWIKFCRNEVAFHGHNANNHTCYFDKLYIGIYRYIPVNAIKLDIYKHNGSDWVNQIYNKLI